MNEKTELVPPHSIEAEQALLGAIFLDNDMLHVAAEIVTKPIMFYRAAHQNIYQAMLELEANGAESIDWITVANHLSKKGILDSCGGQSYLEEISIGTPVADGAEQYATVVKDKSVLRLIVESTTKVRASAYDLTADPDKLRDLLRRTVDVIDGITSKQIPNMQEVLDKAQATANEAYENQALPGWNIGHPVLDDKMLGWQKGGVTAIAAPQGGGKSFSAYSLCKLFQEHNPGCKAAFISMEMRPEELIERQVVQDRFFSDAVTNQATPSDKANADRRIREARANPVQIVQPKSKDIDTLLALARSLTQRGFKFIVIDYIGLVQLRSHSKRSNENEDAANHIPRFKDLASQAEIHILILSQMNKEGMRKSLTQFEMVDLTGSRGSALVSDAHSVAIFFRLISQRKDPIIAKVIGGLSMETVSADVAFGGNRTDHRLFSDDEIRRIVIQKTVKGRRGVDTFTAYWRTDDDLVIRPLVDREKVKVLNKLISNSGS